MYSDRQSYIYHVKYVTAITCFVIPLSVRNRSRESYRTLLFTCFAQYSEEISECTASYVICVWLLRVPMITSFSLRKAGSKPSLCGI